MAPTRISPTTATTAARFVLAATLIACPAGAQTGGGEESRIVEFSNLDQASSIRVSATPTLVIGTALGDPRSEFGYVADAAMLSTGVLAVLDSGVEPRIRLFTAAGAPLDILGREGEGPGEFRQPQALVATPGDTLITWDNPVRQVVWFDPDQGVVRQSYHRNDPSSPHDGVLLPDGSRLIREWDGSAAPHDRVSRYSAVLKRFANDSVIELGPYPKREQFVDGNGFPSWVPFAKESFVAGGGPHEIIVAGDSERWMIRVWRYDGTPLFEIRREGGLVTATRAQRDRAEQQFLTGPVAQMRGEEYANRVWRRADMDSYRHLPAFSGLWVDALGLIWVGLWSEADRPGWATPEGALVFDPRGRLLGRVELPGGVRILEIHAGHLIGVTRDDWAVQRLVVHAIER